MMMYYIIASISLHVYERTQVYLIKLRMALFYSSNFETVSHNNCHIYEKLSENYDILPQYYEKYCNSEELSHNYDAIKSELYENTDT